MCLSAWLETNYTDQHKFLSDIGLPISEIVVEEHTLFF
jgi:hypothetical protein